METRATRGVPAGRPSARARSRDAGPTLAQRGATGGKGRRSAARPAGRSALQRTPLIVGGSACGTMRYVAMPTLRHWSKAASRALRK